MSVAIPASAPAADAAPRGSRWRAVAVGCTVFGFAAYFATRYLARNAPDAVPPMLLMFGSFLGPVLALAAFGAWWVVAGPGPWGRRWLAAGAVLAGAVVMVLLADPTVWMFAGSWGVPRAVAAGVLIVAVLPRARYRPVMGILAALVLMAPWLVVRMDGVSGQFDPETTYRWTPAPADAAAANLAARTNVTATAPADAPDAATAADWPGFRGADRGGVVPPAALAGWSGGAPKALWTAEVGPGWSSFAVVGNFVWTMEQRGESECVVCYRADTGKEVWARGETGKHTDFASQSGPRATPTYAAGRVYSVTASGVVSCLNAATGEPVWAVNLETRFGATKPYFGHSASALVLGENLIVHPASGAAPRLAALDLATGETRWAAEQKGTDGYCSPELRTLAGVPQLLIFNGAGLFGHDPATGRELWGYEWKVGQQEPTTCLPLVLPGDRVLIAGGNMGMGVRCVAVKKDGAGWAAGEAWRTTKFTPKFNDAVLVGGHVYGLDNGKLVCLDTDGGKVVWKEGQYGSGQLLLAGDKLLILAESGKLACVAASPDGFDELWTAPALTGKTWNHPAVARGRLFVRNLTTAAAFELPK